MNKQFEPKFFEVDVEHANRRLDNYLLSQLKNVPKSLLYRLMRKGGIRVNKKRVKPDYRLKDKDLIRVCPIQMNIDDKPKIPDHNLIEKLEKRIIYEDKDILIINKPCGFAVHGGSGIHAGLIETLRVIRTHDHFLELVHRLDKETSGCLIIAKRPRVLREIHELFREGKVKKTYCALTLGRWKNAVNRVNASLKKNILKSGERMVKVDDEGKEAISEFHVIKTFSQSSLMEVILLTGRTHQIRVHASFSGHSVAGDIKYGDRAFNNIMRKKGLHRMFLHASRVSFLLSSSGKKIDVQVPFDAELNEVIKNLEGVK